jgi:hypothetical protein
MANYTAQEKADEYVPGYITTDSPITGNNARKTNTGNNTRKTKSHDGP